MSQSPKKKGFGYYFRIEFSSLQGKITTGFCTLGLVAVILMLLTGYLLKPSINKYSYINEVIYPTHLQVTLLQKNISEAVHFSEKRYLKDLSAMSREELAKLIRQVQQPLDSLSILSTRWDSKEEIYSFQIARNRANSLIEHLKTANSSQDSLLMAQLFGQTLPLLNQEITTNLATILQNQATLRESYNILINQRNENFIWILFACFIVAFIVGATIGSFIVRQVLRVIRQLKYSILELSEGTLIAPIPPSKNELNSIGKAINTLTDKLRNISEFAVEVGKGNLDNKKLKFDNEGVLTQSLYEMQEGLKKIAEEERTRNWTSEGLARFNEYFRQNEENIDQFAANIISKITRYLDANQGFMYILNSEKEDQPVLELKGCYAYDRQKFLTKTIEPGQGLVGQVFLEKEYIYLKNVPQNFMSITSGLGEATAKYLLIIPLKFNGAVNGIIELASLNELPDYKISFLEKLTESLSSAISQVNTSHVTSHLLKQAQEMAEEMKAQEEMLRQNAEEMSATQEKLDHEIAEMKEDILLKEAALSQIQTAQIVTDQHFNIKWCNKKAEELMNQSLHQLNNKSIKSQLSFEKYKSLEEIAAASVNGPKKIVKKRILIQENAFEMQLHSFSAGDKKYHCINLAKIKTEA